MAFVGVALSVGTAVGLSGTAAIIGGGALIGAGVGGAYSAITGDGNVLNSMLTGGLIGGAGAYGIGAMGYGGAGVQAQMAGPFFGGTTAGGAGAGLKTAATSTSVLNPALKVASTGTPGAAQAASELGFKAAALPTVGGAPASATYGSLVGPSAGLSNLAPTAGMTGGQKLALGLGATSLLSLMGSQNQPKLPAQQTQGMIRPYTYSSTPNPAGGAYPSPYATAQYDMAGNPILDTRERDYFDQTFTAGEPYKAARGGLMAAYQSGGPVERMSQMNTAINPQGGLYPQGMIDKTQYAMPTQRPTSMEVIDAGAQRMYAKGGETEDEDESYLDRMKRIKQMKNMLDEIKETGRVAPPDLGEYIPTMREYKPSRLNLMAMPQAFVDAPDTKGVMGRIGGVYSLDRDTQLLGGLSGFAGRDRGALTVKPSTADIGIARRMGPGILSGQYERSLTGQQPARYMANYNIPYAEGGITYDPATQRYSGLPEAGGAPAGNSTPLSAELIAQLTPQYQAANPNAFSYDPAKQRYGAVNPSMMQLNAFKADQERMAAEQAAMQAFQPFDSGGGGANGGLARAYAMGGNVQGYSLGGYSDGGRLLRGPGDGVSDDIPATIGNRQPARLADGEFVIPARIVSELGNGSTDAGAKRLYAMMDKIQAGRKKSVGKGKVAVDSKAKKYLPA